jgi:hypothetical protein
MQMRTSMICRARPSTDSGITVIGFLGNLRVATPDNMLGAGRLQELYTRQRLVEQEAARLGLQLAQSPGEDENCDRLYLLRLKIRAMDEESARLGSAISDVLERDLQR